MSWADLKYSNPHEGLHAMRKAYVSAIKGKFSCNVIYQFGVWCGHSIIALQKLFDEYDLPQPTIYGFDSFIGLPKEEIDKTGDKAWFEGNFSAVKDFECATIEEAKQKIVERLPHPEKVVLIGGFYNESLNVETIKKYNIKPADYIDVDCDIYSSTISVLDFVFGNCLYKGETFSVVGYHDWSSTPLYQGGESKAHKEKCKQYCIVCKEFWNNRNNTLFVIA